MDLTGLTERKNQAGTVYYTDQTGEIVAKECTDCRNVKYINHFTERKHGFGGTFSKCRECEARYKQNYRENNRTKINKYQRNWHKENRGTSIGYALRWGERNPDKVSLYVRRRRAREMSLPDTLTRKQQADIYKHFKEGCALRGHTTDVQLDHVIPLASGHGGTTYGNMIPLSYDLNASKKDRCIFDWFADNRDRFGLEQRKFDDLIEYLAGINDMTVEEYEEYVRWCHDNPRSINEINAKEESKEPAS